MWWTRISKSSSARLARQRVTQFIRTVHGVGYAFCATAVDVPAARTPVQVPFCWVVGEGRTWQLAEGDNIIGRDPRSDIWLDAPGVSRRHAIIRVDSRNRRALLEDLGSTNGTFIQRASVDGGGRSPTATWFRLVPSI